MGVGGRASPSPLRGRGCLTPGDEAGAPNVRTRLRCVEYLVGDAPNTAGKLLVEVLGRELQRRFAIRASLEEQEQATNCCVFCMRVAMSFQLAVRGFDIRHFCKDRANLGLFAGEAAGNV